MRLRGIIYSVSLFSLGVGISVFVHWANSPARTQVAVADSPTSQDQFTKTQDIVTDFFSTKVPSTYRVQINYNPTNTNIVQVSIFEAGTDGVQVGITVAPRPGDGINGIPDYLFRARRSDLYELIPTTEFPSDGITFQSLSNDEITTFLFHQQRYASVAISGQTTSSHIVTKLRAQIAKNWQWR